MTAANPPTPLSQARLARIVFLGTKDFALPSFEHLCDNGWQVLALVTQPDRPQGRKQEIIPSRIRLAAQQRGIAVLQPEDLNAPEGLALLAPLRPDILVTVAYGQILKPHILGLAPFGGVNLHGSLLPKYRGAAPVARCMQQGDVESGVTVIQMSPQVDAGGMLAHSSTPIGPEETAATLEARLGQLGAPVLASALEQYLQGELAPQLQDKSFATRAPKLNKEEAAINWQKSAFLVDRFIRAMNPWPLARCQFHANGAEKSQPVTVHLSALGESAVPLDQPPGTVVHVGKADLGVVCGDGQIVRLKTIQTEGRKALGAGEWARGMRVALGDIFQ